MLFKQQMMNLLYALKTQYNILHSEEITIFLDLKNLIEKRKSEILKLVDEGNSRPPFHAEGRLKQLIKEGRRYERKFLKTQSGHVVSLNLSDWLLKEIPESIGDLKQLETLDLSYNKFETLPDSIEKLTSLKKLSLNSNFNLQTIPTPIRNLAKKTFARKYTKRGVVHKEAIALALLEILSGEVMEEFPEGKKLWELEPLWHHYRLNKKGFVTEIYLIHSEFMHIVLFPKELCTLRNLEVLILHDHWIKSIPPCIGRLNKLRTLDLSFNDIKSMPDSINEIKTLEDFKM